MTRLRWNAYAWSLAAGGDYRHAQEEIRKALAFGLKDAKVLDHARAIQAHCESACDTLALPVSHSPLPR
ncbi:MAG TPA: hypothetical protein VIY49_29690 [Bryobacteraceae bacterium]